MRALEPDEVTTRYGTDAVWGVDASDWPTDGTPTERLAFLVRYALLAPSGHNTQPWRFRIVGDQLELRADHRRRLPVVDPHDRALVISCGAALFHLRVAAQVLASPPSIRLLPDTHDPTLLARLRLDGQGAVIPGAAELLAAIPQRRTHRAPFLGEAVPHEVLGQLRADVAAEYAHLLLVLDDEARRRVAAMVAEGDRRQLADRAFRHELAAWVRPNTSHATDGVRGYGFGVPDLLSWGGPYVIRHFDTGRRQAAKDRTLAQDAPVLAAVVTARDLPDAWLHAGQAVARLLLRAHGHGIGASFLNQPIEVDALRDDLATELGATGDVQLLLRLGRALSPPPPPQPRRPVEEVLTG